MEGRGRFGLLRARYEITPDRIILRRSWLPAVFLLGGPACIYLLHDVFSSIGPEPMSDTSGIIFETLFGTLCFVAFIVALFTTPWRKPRKLVVTSAGVACDDDWYDMRDVTRVAFDSKEQRGKNGVTYDVGVEVHVTTHMPYRYAVCSSGTSAPSDVGAFINACNDVIRRAKGEAA